MSWPQTRPSGPRRQGWCRRGVGTSPVRFPGRLGRPSPSVAVGRRYDTVSFLSDYGLRDEFVGVVKAVIRDIARHVTRHRPHPRDRPVRRPRRVAGPGPLRPVPAQRASCSAVVDPGVGHRPAGGGHRGRRRRRGAGRAGQRAAGPGRRDGRRCRPGRRAHQPRLPPRRRRGRRSPAATCSPRRRPTCATASTWPSSATRSTRSRCCPASCRSPGADGAGLAAEVLWVDRFGNAQLNVGPDEVAGWGDRVRLRLGETDRSAAVVDAYGDARARARSVWSSTPTGCWRSASTAARRPTSSAWRRATPCTWSPSPTTSRRAPTRRSGAVLGPAGSLRPPMRPATTLALIAPAGRVILDRRRRCSSSCSR